MDTYGLSIFFLPFFLFPYSALTVHVCSPSSCGGGGGDGTLSLRFPFRLSGRQSRRCGYPGFGLLCNTRSQTVLNLPNSGNFLVTKIDYKSQSIYINDPDYCLPKRILTFSLSGTKFKSSYSRNLTFLNCTRWPPYTYRAVPIGCMSGENYTVVAVDSEYAGSKPVYCENMSTVEVPVRYGSPYGWSWSSMDLSEDLQLSWSTPNCGGCEAKGGTCGFKSDTGLAVVCSHLPSHGLPRSAKYGIIIGAGIPGLVCIIGLACYIAGKIRAYGHRNQSNAELSTITIHPRVAMMGLDGATIESYPKTVLGESGRLPKPNDGTCPICLCEYLPKETLRTIPECNHYFHASCIDEWLKMNVTCPLCRTSPEGSSTVTPRTSMSSIVSSSSSSTSSL